MILDLGITDYEKAYSVQRDLVMRRSLNEVDDSLILVEHNAVITIGKGGLKNKSSNLLVGEDLLGEYGIKVLEVDRGGDITLHAPGQLVVYPVIDLKERKKDLHLYMRHLESSIIDTLGNFDIRSCRVPQRTGVWISPAEKIAAIGIAAYDWITYHGLSLNVNVELDYFSMIRICGFPGVRATSMKKVLGKSQRIEDVKSGMIRSLSRFFDINFLDHEYITSLD
jgi:lipoate-protein ligase B